MKSRKAGAGVNPQVTLESISYAIGGRVVIDDLSLDLTARRTGIVGRNGSGKTTLARLMAGLIAPDCGNVRVCGIDVAHKRAKAIRVVGILFQNPDHQIIFPTVIEELAFGLRQLGQTKPEAADSARQTLQAFGKAHWEEAVIQTLSQGQRHLVCLMSVLAMKPRVLLLDEPFAGLDLPTRMQLGTYLARTNAAIVHISHDPDTLAGYDQVVWLDRGRIRECGAAAPVLARFRADMIRIGGGDDISDITG